MMIAGATVPVDVNDETPFVPLGIDGGFGVFGLFASGIAFLGVVENGVMEFARGRDGSGRPAVVVIVIW